MPIVPPTVVPVPISSAIPTVALSSNINSVSRVIDTDSITDDINNSYAQTTDKELREAEITSTKARPSQQTKLTYHSTVGKDEGYSFLNGINEDLPIPRPTSSLGRESDKINLHPDKASIPSSKHSTDRAIPGVWFDPLSEIDPEQTSHDPLLDFDDPSLPGQSIDSGQDDYSEQDLFERRPNIQIEGRGVEHSRYHTLSCCVLSTEVE